MSTSFKQVIKKHISHVVIMRWICSVVLEFHGCSNAAEFLGIAAVMKVENLAGTNLILASTEVAFDLFIQNPLTTAKCKHYLFSHSVYLSF